MAKWDFVVLIQTKVIAKPLCVLFAKRLLLFRNMLSGVFSLVFLGLAHGLSRPETVGFCTWDPFLFLGTDLCSSSPEKPTNETPQGPKDHTAPLPSTSSTLTAWAGPKHCVGEFCVYFHLQFSGGIVVITNNENYRRIAELPALKTAGTEPPSFYATEIPGKGVGLVANRTIKRGERVMLWQPTFVIHPKLTDHVPPEDLRYILDAALLRLPAERRRAFLQQMGQFGGHRVSDILLTNAFQMDVGGEGGEGQHLGNFPDVSRFNHDCRPNVAFRIDGQLAHHTHAVRDIAAGEELTLAYMNPFETYAVRQQHILQSWGFKCTCRHCSISEEDIRASDARLYEIEELEAILGDLMDDKASVEMVERLLELYELEQLDAKIHGAQVLAALNYNLFGNAQRARFFARLAADSGVVEFGLDAEDVKAMQELARDPERHFTWKKRLG